MIMKTLWKQFIMCGITGWCIEILFTSFGSLKQRQFTLMGNTSIWMFPIYGMACLIAPFSRILKRKNALFRGICYACGIFTVEFISGNLLNRHRLCPWDYSRSRWNIKQVIRLDFLPYWIGAGLLFERLLTKNKESAG